MDVAAVDVPGAKATDKTLVHRTFFAANRTDAAEERLGLRVQ